MKVGEEGWTRRENQIIRAVNEGDDWKSIIPPLDDEEKQTYDKLVAQHKEMQKQIDEECAKSGVKPWKFAFDLLEVD